MREQLELEMRGRVHRYSPPAPAHASRRRYPSAAIESACLLLARRYAMRAFHSVHTAGVFWVHSAFLSLETLTF